MKLGKKYLLKNGTKLSLSEQNFISSHNCYEIRNKILLKTKQNIYFQNETFQSIMSSHNCNEIKNKILLKTEQIIHLRNSEQNFSKKEIHLLNKTLYVYTFVLKLVQKGRVQILP